MIRTQPGINLCPILLGVLQPGVHLSKISFATVGRSDLKLGSDVLQFERRHVLNCRVEFIEVLNGTHEQAANATLYFVLYFNFILLLHIFPFESGEMRIASRSLMIRLPRSLVRLEELPA